ncbi:MAG: glycosyltransferase family 92 protein [Selenomonadaceae bacterium]|nr:glycosyltransferase family 92 protein [Selenomonadaceae bacterium]
MAVEKNLFKYNLAVVSFVSDAADKIAEWLDYHFLAGADHFYIYDNDGGDTIKEILKPYVDAEIVTYIPCHGANKKILAYNDAVEKFKFECRYMSFLDVDEFIFPRKNQSILEVIDEILSDKESVGGIELNRYTYMAGRNVSADAEGVLEKMTRRGRKATEITNTAVNPRKVDFLYNTRYASYFDGIFRINDYSTKVTGGNFKVSEQLIVNSYKPEDKTKDNELADANASLSSFYRANVFDDGIVRYRKTRRENFGGEIIQTVAENKITDEQILNVLAKTLLPSFDEVDAAEFFKSPENQLKYFRAIGEFYVSAPDDFFQDKMETFLTCFNVSSRLKKNFLNDVAGRFFEDAALNAICQTLCTELSPADSRLLIRELPKIIPLPYKTVEILLSICAGMIDKMIETAQNSSDATKNDEIDENEMALWRKVTELTYLQKLLKLYIPLVTFDVPTNKA